MGAYDEAHWQTAVGEIKPGIGVLRRGTVLCAGSGADAGKLVLTAAGGKRSAFCSMRRWIPP